MIPPAGGPKPGTLFDFFQTEMTRVGTRGTMPNYKTIDRDLVRDIRTEYQNGNLTGDELGRVTNKAGDADARTFLNKLSSNPKSAQLKADLAAEGISLTDESDVGPGERFETLEEKASYVGTRYEYSVRTIFPSIVAYGWGFIDPRDVTNFEQDRVFNSPAERDALQVDVPVAYGGSGSVRMGRTDIRVEEWLLLAESFFRPAEAEKKA